MNGKDQRRQAWKNKKARRDGNHGKNGMVAGNPRYGDTASSLKSHTAEYDRAAMRQAMHMLNPNQLAAFNYGG